MKKNNYLFKSKYYLTNYILYNCAAVLFVFLFPFVHQEIYFIWSCFLIWFLINFIFLFFFYYIFYFYEGKIVRKFAFNPFFKQKEIFYDQLYKVQFINIGGMGEYPRFKVYRKNFKFFKCVFHTFYFRKRAMRIEIVKFLLSKNVNIEVVIHIIKENKEIIDFVKAKYPNNIHMFENRFDYIALDKNIKKSYDKK